jgi:hypothetical protein
MSLPRSGHITRTWRRDAIDVASHIGDINSQILWVALPLQEISNCIIQLEVKGFCAQDQVRFSIISGMSDGNQTF